MMEDSGRSSNNSIGRKDLSFEDQLAGRVISVTSSASFQV